MGRVHSHHAPPGASGAVGPVHHKRAEPKKKPTYKVIFEEIAGKKKLKTVLSLREKPPSGYTFIPAGDPQLTNRCKKLAKDEQLTVYIVSTSKHPHEQLSTEVHRIGYHFPSIIVDQACTSLGVTLTQSGRVLQSRFAFIDDQGSSNQHHGRRPTKGKIKGKKRQASPKLDMSLSQAVIDTTAREAIKDLFPNIPSKDQKEIVGRAFQKGKGLVGTVSELSLVRRAQLAVTAHIRHMYTDYDLLLKSMRWGEARQAVQQQCLDKLVQWRGDDDDDGEMADILQEVIVISDDEEDEVQHDANMEQRRHGRSDSVEFISADDINTQAINYAAAKSAAGPGRSLSPDSIDGAAVTYLGHAPLLNGSPVRYNQQRLDQMGVHRHRIWEEAVDRGRKNPDMLYSTDNRPSLSAPGTFVPDYSQVQQEDSVQPYGSQPVAHSFDRPSTYTRVVPLPALRGQSSHVSGPHRGEKRIFTDQATPTFQQQQLSSSRFVDDPSNAFHAREVNSSYPELPVYGNRLLPVRTQYEDARFVESQELSRETLDPPHSHPLQSPPSRHSELVLPSIEGGLPKARNQQPVSPHQHQGVSYFSQRDVDDREIRRPRDFSDVYVKKEEPHAKRRRINDQQPPNDRQPRTVLVPLHHRAEDYPRMTTGPAKAVYYENVPPSTHDRRIVQLPPREARRYEDNQKRIQVMIHDGHVENRSVHQLPGEEYEPRYVNPRAPAQPQSPKRSVSFQPGYDQQSPTFFSRSAPSHREILNQRPPSRHTFSVDEGAARVFSDSYAARIQPLRSDDVGRDMRAKFGNLKIDFPQHRDEDISINGNMNNGRPVHAFSQAQGTGYLPRSPQTILSMPNSEGVRQTPMSRDPFDSRHVQQQHSMQDRAAGPSKERLPINTHPTSEQIEKATTNPFQGHSSATMANSVALQWSGLCNHSRAFDHANTMMARNRETLPWEGASLVHTGNGLPQASANTGHGGNENIRPRVQSYKSSGQTRSRMPGEIVVLE